MAEEWLARLAEENAQALRAFLSSYSQNPADIDDWIQEALLRVFAASRWWS